jgi:NAD(P)-dependent dehydrogenase (short-subunit alcohol dehydrogenase family)
MVDRFVEEGATVAVAQRSPLDAALHEEKAVVHIPVDLSDASVLSRVVDDAAAELGGLDILVNNAGVMFERAAREALVRLHPVGRLGRPEDAGDLAV